MVYWNEAYATGVQDIDDQHKELFEYIGQLEGCIQEGVYEGSQIEIILNFLQMFCSTHFCLEEGCMRQRACPVQEKNKQAHEKFLAYFKSFRKTYELSNQKQKYILELHKVLLKWLVQHIVKIDMHVKNCKVVRPEAY